MPLSPFIIFIILTSTIEDTHAISYTPLVESGKIAPLDPTLINVHDYAIILPKPLFKPLLA